MLLREYVKAVDKLTILNVDDASSASQLQKQVTELKEKSKEENWEAEQQRKELEQMKAEQAEIKNLLQMLHESKIKKEKLAQVGDAGDERHDETG